MKLLKKINKLKFNAKDLGAIFGVPAEGFDVYVREDKTVLGPARLSLGRRISMPSAMSISYMPFQPSQPNFLLILSNQFALLVCPLCPQLFALLVYAFDS